MPRDSSKVRVNKALSENTVCSIHKLEGHISAYRLAMPTDRRRDPSIATCKVSAKQLSYGQRNSVACLGRDLRLFLTESMILLISSDLNLHR